MDATQAACLVLALLILGAVLWLNSYGDDDE
jgi:hypothetical protein